MPKDKGKFRGAEQMPAGALGLKRGPGEILYIGPTQLKSIDAWTIAMKGPASVKFLREEIAPLHLVNAQSLAGIHRTIDDAHKMATKTPAEQLVGDLDAVELLRRAVILLCGGLPL